MGKHEHALDHHQSTNTPEQSSSTNSGRPYAPETGGQQGHSPSDRHHQQQSAQEQRVQWPSSNGRPVAHTEGNGQQSRSSSDNQQQQQSAQDQPVQWPSSNRHPVASGANSSSATEHRNEATPQTGQGPVSRVTQEGSASPHNELNQADLAEEHIQIEHQYYLGSGVEATTHLRADVNANGRGGIGSVQANVSAEIGGRVQWRIGRNELGVGTNVSAGPGGSSVGGYASWERNGFKLSATGTANSEGSQNVEVTASFGEDKSHEPTLTNDQGLADANNAVTNAIENSRWTPQAREAFLRAAEFHPFPPQDPLLPPVEGHHHTQEQQNRTRDH